jgi:hypothetical protein
VPSDVAAADDEDVALFGDCSLEFQDCVDIGDGDFVVGYGAWGRFAGVFMFEPSELFRGW